jgi:hypothetical protein
LAKLGAKSASAVAKATAQRAAATSAAETAESAFATQLASAPGMTAERIAAAQAAARAGGDVSSIVTQMTPEIKTAAEVSRKAFTDLSEASRKLVEAERLVSAPGVVEKAAKIAAKNDVTAPAMVSKFGQFVESGADKLMAPVGDALEAPLQRLGAAMARPASESAIAALQRAAPYIKDLPKASQEILAKATAKGLGTSAELALFNVGQGAHEDILGDKRLAAERSLAYATDGVLGNFALGAGLSVVPSAVSAALTVAGGTTRALRDVTLRFFRPMARVMTDATEAELLALEKNREALGAGRSTVAEILESDLNRQKGFLSEPVAPAPAQYNGPLSVFEPVPVPVAPTPIAKSLSKQEIDDAARSLTDALRSDYEASRSVQASINGIVSKEQAAESIKLFYDEQVAAAQKAYVDSFGGAPIPGVYQTMGNEVGRSVLAKPAQEASRIAGQIEEIIKIAENEIAAPMSAQSLGQMKLFRQKLIDLSESGFHPVKMEKELGKLKGMAWKNVVSGRPFVGLPPDQKAASNAFRGLWSELKSVTENPEVFGPFAAKRNRWNSAVSKFNTADENLANVLADDIKTSPAKTDIRYSTKKAATFVKQMGTAAADDVAERFAAREAAKQEMMESAREIAEGYEKSYGAEAMASTVGSLAKAYEDAQALSVTRMSRAAQQEANILAVKSAQALEAGRVQRADAIITRLRSEAGAKNAAYDEAMQQFKAQVAERKEFISKRASALTQAAEGKFLYDALAAGALGAGNYFDNPVLKAGAEAFLALRLAANPVRTLKTLSWIEKAAKATETASKQYASALVSGVTVPSAYTGRTSSLKQEREFYQKMTGVIQQYANNTSALDQHLNDSVSEIKSHAPGVADEVVSAKARAISRLAAEIAAVPEGLSPHERANYEPLDSQKIAINNKIRAVMFPTATFARIVDGSATAAEIRLMNDVYPALMDDFRSHVLSELKKNPNPSAQSRQAMQRLLGISVDGSVRLGVSAQNIYGGSGSAAQQQAPQKPVPVSRIENMNVAGRVGQETVDRREDQRNARLP